MVTGADGSEGERPTTRAGLRLVRRLVAPNHGPFFASITGSAVFAGCTVLAAWVLGWVADEVVIAVEDPDRLDPPRSAVLGASAILAVAVLRAVGVVSRRWFAGMTSERAEMQARAGLTRQYLGQPMSWLRGFPTGRLIAHVDADVTVLTQSLHPLPFSIGVIVLAVTSAISLLLIDVWVALVALVLFPLMFVVNTAYSRAVERPLAEMQEEVARVAGIAHESFEGALIVKTLGRRDAEMARFGDAAHALRERRERVALIRIVMDAFLTTLPTIGILSVVIIGAYRVDAGSMTPGALVQVAALFNALAIPMLVFGFLLEELIPSVVAWNRLSPVIEAELPTQPAEPWTGTTVGPAALAAKGLVHSWPETPGELALDIPDLSVAPGEMLAIVGPTGSGKSTLCAALTGVLDDTRSLISIDGVPLDRWSDRDRADRITLVFQEAFLFAESIRANIDPDAGAQLDTIRVAARAAAIDEWVIGLDAQYDTQIGERGVTVSGGQRQRIALARALVRPAGLVVLDDATSAVDTATEQRILAALRDQVDATLVVVANRLATIERADRVVHLVDGRIAAEGTHTELLENDEYRSLVLAYAEAADASEHGS